MPNKRKKEFYYSEHASKTYVEKRGWSKDTIEDTIQHATNLDLSREIEGEKRLAIVYHHPERPNQYIVRTIDGRIIQVSNLNDNNWKEDQWKEKCLYLVKADEIKRRQSHKHKK